jgi:hypothetical protein
MPVVPRSDGGWNLASLAGTPGGTAPGGLFLNISGSLFFQWAGPLTLTTAQWDAVVSGEVGGLTEGAVYYVGGGAGGELTTTPVGTQVGRALNSTTMLIQIGSPPATLNLPNDGAVVGEAVIIDLPASTVVFSPAPNPGSTAGRVDGLVMMIDSGQVIAALNGVVVTLTTGQWDAVAGTVGGLDPERPYYLSNVTAGHLTSTPPVAPGSYVTRVIVALSATQALVSIGTPIGPHS